MHLFYTPPSLIKTLPIGIIFVSDSAFPFPPSVSPQLLQDIKAVVHMIITSVQFMKINTSSCQEILPFSKFFSALNSAPGRVCKGMFCIRRLCYYMWCVWNLRLKLGSGWSSTTLQFCRDSRLCWAEMKIKKIIKWGKLSKVC